MIVSGSRMRVRSAIRWPRIVPALVKKQQRLNGSYLALAIPVAILTFFALGLVAWVGFTIATIQVEAEPPEEILATDDPVHGAATGAAEDAA